MPSGSLPSCLMHRALPEMAIARPLPGLTQPPAALGSSSGVPNHEPSRPVLSSAPSHPTGWPPSVSPTPRAPLPSSLVSERLLSHLLPLPPLRTPFTPAVGPGHPFPCSTIVLLLLNFFPLPTCLLLFSSSYTRLSTSFSTYFLFSSSILDVLHDIVDEGCPDCTGFVYHFIYLLLLLLIHSVPSNPGSILSQTSHTTIVQGPTTTDASLVVCVTWPNSP